MKTLFKNGEYVNVFTGTVEKANILVEDSTIIGLGDYSSNDCDKVVDCTGLTLCPGFIDSHIHIESTMLAPSQLAKICVPHGTSAIVADPHEIANVCGGSGIEYMLQASEGLPMDVLIAVSSCVPATGFDEAGAVMSAADLRPFYGRERVVALAEMMNYPGVLAGVPDVLQKLEDAKNAGLVLNGHAPLLTGRDLDRYIAAGVSDDHECSSEAEAKERITKGQWIMIRQGTAAKNLPALLPLFDMPWARRCMLVTDDRHPADLLSIGHIDSIIREAVQAGKSAVTAIQMATLQPAEYYGLRRIGAIAPGYRADMLVLEDLNSVKIRDVYHKGQLVVKDGEALPFAVPEVSPEIMEKVTNSFHIKDLTAEDFMVAPNGGNCRVIKLIPHQLLTDQWLTRLDFSTSNGIDTSRDIVKIAVIERHHCTGHIGLGYINGTGISRGAIASSVSHDSHNLIVIGASESDMALAANHIREICGGMVAVLDGKIIAELPLPLGGLMNPGSAEDVAKMNEDLRKRAEVLGTKEGIEPFMNMAFVSLTVIPHLKLTTLGLVDVDTQTLLPLFEE